MAKASIAEKEATISIINRIDRYIPISGFVNEVKNVLEERGILCRTTGKFFNKNQILYTRQLRSYHLQIAQVFEELYDPNYVPPCNRKKKTLIERQKLNMP